MPVQLTGVFTHPQRFIAALFCSTGVMLLVSVVYLFLLAQFPTPADVKDEYRGSTVTLESDNIRLLFESDCFYVRWTSEGAQNVEFNRTTVAPIGEAEACAADAILEVTFAGGATKAYRLSPEVTLGTGLLWQLPLFAIGLFFAGLSFLRPPVIRGTVQPQIEPMHNVYLWVVVGLVLLGTFIRVQFLDVPMRGDEAWTFVEFSSHHLSEALTHYSSTNNHLLHTLFQHITYRIFGNELIWLRLPTFFASLLGIAAAYRTGTDLYNRNTGLLTAVIMTTASVIIEFSVNARGYTLVIAFQFLLLTVAQRALRTNRQRYWAAYTVLVSLSLYTIPTAIFPIGCIGIWTLLNLVSLYRESAFISRLRALSTVLAASVLLTVLLYTPILITLASSSGEESAALQTIAPSRTLPNYAVHMVRELDDIGEELAQDVPVILLVMMSIGLGITLIRQRRMAKEPISLAFAILLALITMHYIARPSLYWRTYLFVVPLFSLLAFAGWTFIVDRLIFLKQFRHFLTALVVLTVLLSTLVLPNNVEWITRSYDTFPGGAEAAAYLAQSTERYDVVLARNPSYNVLRYYLGRYENDSAHHFLSRLGYRYSEDMQNAETILLVVSKPNENLEELVRYLRFDPLDYAAPERLADLGQTELWLYHAP